MWQTKKSMPLQKNGTNIIPIQIIYFIFIYIVLYAFKKWFIWEK